MTHKTQSFTLIDILLLLQSYQVVCNVVEHIEYIINTSVTLLSILNNMVRFHSTSQQVVFSEYQ